MKYATRLYYCLSCIVKVIICSNCDKGNVYCVQCAPIAKAKSKKAAAKRYQNSRQGRINHAKRQRAYRQRQKEINKKVTHMGSQKSPLYDLLSIKRNSSIEKGNNVSIKTTQTSKCDFCSKSLYGE